MKAKITQAGVYDSQGKRVNVGTELPIKGDTLPRYLVGKATLSGAEVAITNPAKTKKRIGLEEQATEAGVDFDGLSDEDLIAAIKAAKAN
jgi:hypothetical protein